MPVLYQEALKTIQTAVAPLRKTQTLSLLKAMHRISATNVHAHFALPKYPMSLKEGYGFILKEPTDDALCIPWSQTVRLSTGDFVPAGINAVVAEEDAHIDYETNRMILNAKPSLYQNIKHQGEDIAKGEILLQRFERISAYKITALSSQGIHRIKVLKKPVIGIISIGEALANGHVANSNAMSLAGRIIELGGTIETMVVCRENTETILEHLHRLSSVCDCIVTTGALSHKDAMRALINQNVFETLFDRVKLTPSQPSALSLLNATPILHLPGLPLSCMLGFEMLGVPLLRHLQHYTCMLPDMITCINQKRLTCKASSMNAVPGFSDGRHFLHAPYYEAGRLNILSACNGYTLIENKEVIEEGEEIAFFYF